MAAEEGGGQGTHRRGEVVHQGGAVGVVLDRQLEGAPGIVGRVGHQALELLEAHRHHLGAIGLVPEMKHRQVFGAADVETFTPGPGQQRR